MQKGNILPGQTWNSRHGGQGSAAVATRTCRDALGLQSGQGDLFTQRIGGRCRRIPCPVVTQTGIIRRQCVDLRLGQAAGDRCHDPAGLRPDA